MAIIISLIIIAVLIIGYIHYFNKLQVLKNNAAEAESGIDVQLKRRADLIPNLVESVRGYATHESTVFKSVTDARASLLHADTLQDKSTALAESDHAIGRLLAVAESYPQLRASESFTELQEELADTEDKISASRRLYNAAANDLNTAVQTIPSNIVANTAHIGVRQLFEAEESDRKNVEVHF
jgi:LemA protein